jgi:hypothetical protein
MIRLTHSSKKRLSVSGLLLLITVTSVSGYLTDAEKGGMKNQCRNDAFMSRATCEDCIEQVGNTVESYKTSGCYDLCQTYDNDDKVVDCVTCLAMDGTTWYGCKGCLNLTDVDDRAACFASLANPPAWTSINDIQSLHWAIPECYAMPVDIEYGTGRQSCLDCIGNPTASGFPTGYLSFDEVTAIYKANNPPIWPATDFGRCVYDALKYYNMLYRPEEATGMAVMCLNDTSGAFPPADCMWCQIVAGSKDIFNSSGLLDYRTSLAYGCSTFCQKPDINLGEPFNALQCSDCISRGGGHGDAWACGQCTKLNDPFAQTDCFECIDSDNWYLGNASNYNWACAECSKIIDPTLRASCIQCIQNQDGASDGQVNVNTTVANICSCVDLANGDIRVNSALAGMERTCYEPWNETVDIPWGADFPIEASSCIACMNAVDGEFKYGCHDYCQDPNIVLNQQQGDDCSECISNAAILAGDVHGCKTCMTATDDTESRRVCFNCVATPSPWDSHAWGCGECAQLPIAIRNSCYFCLTEGLYDPCVCIECVKNGTCDNGPGVVSGPSITSPPPPPPNSSPPSPPPPRPPPPSPPPPSPPQCSIFVNGVTNYPGASAYTNCPGSGTPANQCHLCHGMCCSSSNAGTNSGKCQSSSCSVNFPWTTNEVNCNMNVQAKSGPTYTETSSSESCPSELMSSGFGSGIASYICDTSFYSGCTDPLCLGRIKCTSTNQALCTASLIGADCFLNGGSGNYKICLCPGNSISTIP